MSRKKVVALAAGSLCSTVVCAQSPPDAGAQLREQQRLDRRMPDRIPSIEREAAVKPALRPAGGERVWIRAIRFSGAVHLVAETELQALLADAIGQAHDFAALEALAQRVTDHLKAKGFLLARAYLPQQDLTDGVLEIALLAGRLESGPEPVQIVPGGKLSLRIDPERLKAIAQAQLADRPALHQDDLQRALLLMNDLPGITARSRLEPGAEPDTTRVVVDVEEGPLLTLTTSLDNFGNRYTGDLRLNVSAQANDPLGVGDRAGVTLTHTERSDVLALNYSLPLGSDGWRLGVSASELRSRTGKEFAALGLESQADTLGLNLSYPIIRQRLHNLWITLAADRRRYLDTAKGTPTNERETSPVSLGLSGELIDDWGGGGFSQAGLAWVSGELDLKLPAVAAGDAATARRAGSYDKWTWNASRLQRIDADTTFFVMLSGQQARKNLDSSEKFALGGPTAIRAYSGGEAQGDEGWLANIELRHEFPAGAWGMAQLSAFYDTGRIRLNHTPWPGAITNATGRNEYGLSGFGFGLQVAKPGSHQLKLMLARRIGDNPGRSAATGKDADGLSDKTRLWISALFWF